MPQIREYSQRVETPGPVQSRRLTGDDFGAIAARSLQQVGRAGQMVGEVVKQREEQQEVNQGTVDISKAHADFTAQLQDGLQKGTINTEQFAEQYDQKMSELSEKFSTSGGQQYFQKAAASMRTHFIESANAAQSELAAEKTKQNYLSTLNNFSSGLMGDPSSLGTVKQLHTDYIDNLVKNGSLPATVASKLKSEGEFEIMKASARGWIELDPYGAKKKIQSGEYDSVGGDAKRQLLAEADSNIRGREVDAERIRQQQKKNLEIQQTKTQNDFLQKMVEGSLSAKDILRSNLDPIGSGSKEQFLRLMETANKEKLKTDSTVFTDTFSRIHLPDGDPNKITDENSLNNLLGKGLTLSDIKDLRQEMQGRGTQAGDEESALKKQIINIAEAKLTKRNPLTGMTDPQGEEQLQKFSVFFMNEYSKQRKAGKSAKDLLDPESKDYLGKYIGNYAKTAQQIMKDTMNATKPIAPVALPDGTIPNQPAGSKPKKPGETIEQWRKRTKGS